MKQLLETVFLVLLPTFLLAQPFPMSQTAIDSLTEKLKTLPQDTNRVMALYWLARVKTSTNPTESIQLSEQGIDLAQKNNFPVGKMNCLRASAFAYGITGSPEKGIKLAYEAIELSRKYAPIDEVYLLNIMSLCYGFAGDDKESFIWAEKAYKHPLLFEVSDVALGRWASMMQLGHLYEKFNNLDSGFYFAQKSLVLSKEEHLSSLEAYSLAILSRIAFKRNQFNDAIDYNQQSTTIHKKFNNEYPIH